MGGSKPSPSPPSSELPMSSELPIAPASTFPGFCLIRRETFPAMGGSSSSAYLVFFARFAAPFLPFLPPPPPAPNEPEPEPEPSAEPNSSS